jgi:hypothetical protein
MYCADDLIRKLEAQNYTPRGIVPPGVIVPVPPPEPPPTPEPGSYITTGNLNVRSSPEVLGETNKVVLPGVCPLPTGTRVEVLEIQGNWARIATPFKTWCHTDWLEEV